MGWKLPTAATVIVVLLLVAGGALIGLLIRGDIGAVAGAVILAVGGVVTGYVPLFRDRAERRRAELRQAEAKRAVAQAGMRAASEPQLDAPASGQSLLLRPELGVVEFAGRLAELAELRTWCEMNSPRSVRVLVGAGGVGKTRLALKIAAEWEAAGRARVMVANHDPGPPRRGQAERSSKSAAIHQSGITADPPEDIWVADYIAES